MFVQGILSLCQLGPGLVPLRPGTLPFLLRIKDGALTTLHHLACLFEILLALGEVFLALSSRANGLLILLSQPVDLMLHIYKP